jgi:hypothetical protein
VRRGVLAMAHSCPEGFLPLADAFAQALSALEGCEELARLSGEAIINLNEWERKPSAETVAAFLPVDKHDSALRRVERLMRNALADGQLHAFVKARNGRIECLIEREEWREEAFGVPGIDNIPHHITNPGPDTEGQPALLKISNFQEWLTTHRHAINPFRTGAPGKPSAIRIIEGEHQRRIARGIALDSVGKEAEYLKDWLDSKYPDAPQTTKKTIENRIRAAHRRRAPK